jgi:hypothetical protein
LSTVRSIPSERGSSQDYRLEAVASHGQAQIITTTKTAARGHGDLVSPPSWLPIALCAAATATVGSWLSNTGQFNGYVKNTGPADGYRPKV